jgi:hypothetical protein
LELFFEEFIVFILDLSNNLWGVNIFFIIFPVNRGKFFSTRVLSIVVIKNGVLKNLPLLTGKIMKKIFTPQRLLERSRINTMNSSKKSSKSMVLYQDAELDLN